MKIKTDGDFEVYQTILSESSNEFDASVVLELYNELVKWLFLDTDHDLDISQDIENPKIFLLLFSLINSNSTPVMQQRILMDLQQITSNSDNMNSVKLIEHFGFKRWVVNMMLNSFEQTSDDHKAIWDLSLKLMNTSVNMCINKNSQ